MPVDLYSFYYSKSSLAFSSPKSSERVNHILNRLSTNKHASDLN